MCMLSFEVFQGAWRSLRIILTVETDENARFPSSLMSPSACVTGLYEACPTCVVYFEGPHSIRIRRSAVRIRQSREVSGGL